jgi:hypothetical protein
MKSVRYGEEEVVGKTFKVSANSSGRLGVTLRASTATVRGSVNDARGKPVSGINVVFAPADRSRADLFRTMATDQNGRYSMTNLAPGEYKVFSWESIDNGAYLDPEFMKEYEQLGKAIVVSEATNPDVDVKVIPAQ